MKLEMRLGDEDRIRFLWPTARSVATSSGAAELFDSSHDFAGRFAGFHWLLTRIAHPGKPDPERRFADATAVAGLQAVQSCTRRAVIVVLGRDATDKSRHSPERVRAYLERVHVPLYVWSLVTVKAGAPGPWGEAEEISSAQRLKSAVERLKRDLDEQAIVWVEGQHLPQGIALAEKAVGMRIVR